MCMISSLWQRGRNLADSVESWWRGAAERRRLAYEFGRLDDRDVARVLADIGCSREDLDAVISNAPLSRPLLEGMVARLGVGAAFAAADSATVREIERRCTTCSTQSRCRSWLRRGTAREGYKEFCPNAETFGAMARAAAPARMS